MPKTKPEDGALVAPEPEVQPVRRPAPTIERQGSRTVPVTRRWPQVRGGICEFCGTIDPLVRSEDQYLLCPHFREIGKLRCSYCDDSKNPDDIIYHSVLNIAAHPADPDKLIVWCNSYTCSQKHEKRFLVSQ